MKDIFLIRKLQLIGSLTIQLDLLVACSFDEISVWHEIEIQITEELIGYKEQNLASSQNIAAFKKDPYSLTIDVLIKRLLSNREYLVSSILAINQKKIQLIKNSLKCDNPVYGGKTFLPSCRLINKVI